MRILKSNLELELFNILSCLIETIPTKSKITSAILSKNPVELDFDILHNSKNSNKIRILVHIQTPNDVKEIRGYRFSIISEAFFYIKGLRTKPAKEQNQYILFTAVPIAIAMVRSHLYNVTANFPYPQYILPSIDLRDLFEKKFQNSQKK
jgi:preprotein translocase subunit SecB